MIPTEPGSATQASGGARAALVLVVAVLVGAGGYFVNRTLTHVEQLNTRIGTLEETLQRTADEAALASRRAVEAEQSAQEETASRAQAEADAGLARQAAADAGRLAESAAQRANVADRRATDAVQTSIEAQDEARRAREEADEIRRVAEAEMNRLTEALGRIADTRRTALGLVMSLDEGYLKFDFDQAELRPESREMLSRIAGILFTATDSAITISGHTDARGEAQYNQELSERRARAVADYLIQAGLAPELFTVEGLGKSQPLDPGDTLEAHSKNRRVELGIVNARIIDSYADSSSDASARQD